MRMELKKYNNREELLAAYRKMKQRKRDWQEQCRKEYNELLESIQKEESCC